MKKISIAGTAVCLLLGLANAQAADMSQNGMNKSGTEMKNGAMMHKGSMDKDAMQGAGKSGSMMHKSGMMHKDKSGAMMHKDSMGKDAMQK